MLFTSPSALENRPSLLFERDKVASTVRKLASANVFIGTSSWKYAGWCGMIYDEQRYIWKGKFGQKRFEELCLREYAELFKTVCVDGAYYRFPDRPYIENLVTQVPGDFLFGLKVTDEITIKRFSQLPRFGTKGGQLNPNFLNAELFASSFLAPFEPFRKNVGLLIFEFSRLTREDFPEINRSSAVAGSNPLLVDRFVETLARFLHQLPKGWPYGVEVRNPEFLTGSYFETLRKHQVAHIYNSWAEMPAVSDQLQISHSSTSASHLGARFLLKPGRKYQEAVELFSPYTAVKEPYEEARRAGARLIQDGVKNPARKTFIFVNNRLEGSAPLTIQAMLASANNG